MIDKNQDLDWCLEHWRNQFINSNETFVELWQEHIKKQQTKGSEMPKKPKPKPRPKCRIV